MPSRCTKRGRQLPSRMRPQRAQAWPQGCSLSSPQMLCAQFIPWGEAGCSLTCQVPVHMLSSVLLAWAPCSAWDVGSICSPQLGQPHFSKSFQSQQAEAVLFAFLNLESSVGAQKGGQNTHTLSHIHTAAESGRSLQPPLVGRVRSLTPVSQSGHLVRCLCLCPAAVLVTLSP